VQLTAITARSIIVRSGLPTFLTTFGWLFVAGAEATKSQQCSGRQGEGGQDS